MAGYFKKRRGPSGPNKNEQKVARAEEARRPGASLGQRYPCVQRLVVQLDILSPQQRPLSQERRVFSPGDPCDFSVPCPGRCGAGAFDLAAKIEAVVATGETASASSGKCHEPLYAGSAETCGCELKCRVEATYVPVAAPAATQAPVHPLPMGPQPIGTAEAEHGTPRAS